MPLNNETKPNIYKNLLTSIEIIIIEIIENCNFLDKTELDTNTEMLWLFIKYKAKQDLFFYLYSWMNLKLLNFSHTHIYIY